MKKVIYFSVFNLILLFAISCGTKKTAAQLSEQKRISVEKIENEIKVNPDLANIIEKIKEDIQ